MTKKARVLSLAVIGLVLAWLVTISYLTIVRPLQDHSLFFSQDRQGNIYPLDFLHFYQAGKLAAGSMHEHVYDPQVQLTVLNQIIAPYTLKNVLYTQHTPLLFVLMRPFASLSLEQAYLLWMVIAVVTTCGGIWLLLRKCRHLSRLDTSFYMVWLIGSMPAFSSIRTGQLTWLILFLLSVFVWSWMKGKNVLAGLCLSLMTIKPQYALFFIVAAVARRQWKVIAYAAVFELALLSSAAFTIGFSNVINYPFILVQADQSTKFIGIVVEPMVNLRRLLSIWLPASSMQLSLAGMVMALIWNYRLWCEQTLLDHKEKFHWVLSLTVLISLFFSPHTLYYDCFLLAIPACLTLPPPERIWQTGRGSSWLKVWIGLLFLYPLLSWIICLCMPNKRLQSLPFLLIDLALLIAGTIFYYGFLQGRQLYSKDER
jgi:hypothetical protein